MISAQHSLGRLGALVAGLLLSSSPALVGPAQAQAPKPNIVVIMGDDIGMWKPDVVNRVDQGSFGEKLSASRAESVRPQREIGW